MISSTDLAYNFISKYELRPRETPVAKLRVRVGATYEKLKIKMRTFEPRQILDLVLLSGCPTSITEKHREIYF